MTLTSLNTRAGATARPAKQGSSGMFGEIRPLIAAFPVLCLLAVFLLAPLLAFFAKGFVSDQTAALTFENYAGVLLDSSFRQSLLNSVYVALLSTFLALVLAVPTALHLTRLRGMSRGVADAVLAFPLSLPGVVIGFFTIVLFGRAGMATQAEQALTGTNFLQISYQLPGLMFAYMYFQLPRVLATIQGAAEIAEATYEEVAVTLGASGWQTFKDVLLPPLYPAILSAAAIATATSLGAYGTVAALSEGFRVLPLDIADQATLQHHAGLAASMAVLLTAISMAFSAAGHHFTKKATHG